MPLSGLWTHTKGGFYDDGRFATLADCQVFDNIALIQVVRLRPKQVS